MARLLPLMSADAYVWNKSSRAKGRLLCFAYGLAFSISYEATWSFNCHSEERTLRRRISHYWLRFFASPRLKFYALLLLPTLGYSGMVSTRSPASAYSVLFANHNRLTSSAVLDAGSSCHVTPLSLLE